MKKSNKKGFTLVELVVVIAIIGVLAAILVPSLLGYIKKAKLKKVNSNAKNAATAISGAAAELEEKGITLTASMSGTCSITAGASTDEINNIVKSSISGENGEAYWEIRQNNVGSAEGYTIYAQYRQTAGGMVGQFPNAPKTYKQAESLSFKSIRTSAW